MIDDEVVRRDRRARAARAAAQHARARGDRASARRALPDVPHVAVFDTAFHATIPRRGGDVRAPGALARRVGDPPLRVPRASVEWVAEQVPVPRLVVCHLGGGCSVTAVLDGRSVDTTMGFSPLEGVPMATRSGSRRPGRAPLPAARAWALARTSSTTRSSTSRACSALGGLERPARARRHAGARPLRYRIATAVGAMAVALGGLDALAFTGGVGEGSADVRARVCGRLGFLGAFDVRRRTGPRGARDRARRSQAAGLIEPSPMWARDSRSATRRRRRASRRARPAARPRRPAGGGSRARASAEAPSRAMRRAATTTGSAVIHSRTRASLECMRPANARTRSREVRIPISRP